MLEIALLLLWVAWSAQAILSAMQVRKFWRRLNRNRRRAYDRYRPPAAVVVPFKGLEDNLEDNLRSLCEQDYPDYRVVLVVESEQDPAYPALVQASAACTKPVDIVVAGLADAHEGQKVHNLRAAMEHLQQQDAGEAAWVFADSDAVPGADWLGELVGPLVHTERTAVTTGYRWLVPENSDTGKPTIWSKLASIVNSSAACFMGRDAWNQAWGGSMAVRVDMAKQGNLSEMMAGSISDDYRMTAMCKSLGKRVYFVPRCLVPSPVHFTLPSLINFARRQYLITRIHAPRVYFGGLFVTTLYVAGLSSALIALIASLIQQPADNRWLWPAAAMLVVFAANHVRAYYRRLAIEQAFTPAVAEQLRSTLTLDRWATSLWMTANWLLMLTALVGRTINWRGNIYRMLGPQRVQKL